MKNRRKLLFAIFITYSVTAYSQDVNLYTALEQINAKAIFEKGLTGKGVKIGIIDAGFDGITTWKILNKINTTGQIKFAKNYVPDSITTLYDGDHGSWVLGYIGGYINYGPTDSLKRKDYIEGLAIDADYYIARNEYGPKDHRVEEVYLEQALEEMFNLGVRLVNISSGYTDKYIKRDERYKPKEMDGNTTYISKACNKYADKGMIIVVSAGNEGNSRDFWNKLISAPSDVENVITVGASHFSLFKPDINGKYILKASYSGIGPAFLPYVKPDLVCFSDRGCSFSTPIITGLIATMLEVDSTLTLNQIKEILYKSSTLYPYPNNYIGYGVPNAEKVLSLLENENAKVETASKIETYDKQYMIQTESKNIVLFHKKDSVNVTKQKRIESKNGVVKIKRKASNRTTVIIDNNDAYELIWN
jgi:subtilisin family serine protease